jgi:hypothetical protein
MKLLPSEFQPRDEVPTITVRAIPDQLQESIENVLAKKSKNPRDWDITHFLSRQHLQHMYSTFMGPRGINPSTKDKRPVWEHTIAAINDTENQPPETPDGLSWTISEAIGELATNINNLWSGSIYNKSLDYLLRILLRIHLAPKREEKYKEQSRRKGLKQETPSSKSPMERRASLRKTKSLCDDLSDVIESRDSERMARQVPILLELLDRTMQQGEHVNPTPVQDAPAGSVSRTGAAYALKQQHEQHKDDCPDAHHEELLLFGDPPEGDEGNNARFKCHI